MEKLGLEKRKPKFSQPLLKMHKVFIICSPELLRVIFYSYLNTLFKIVQLNFIILFH